MGSIPFDVPAEQSSVAHSAIPTYVRMCNVLVHSTHSSLSVSIWNALLKVSFCLNFPQLLNWVSVQCLFGSHACQCINAWTPHLQEYQNRQSVIPHAGAKLGINTNNNIRIYESMMPAPLNSGQVGQWGCWIWYNSTVVSQYSRSKHSQCAWIRIVRVARVEIDRYRLSWADSQSNALSFKTGIQDLWKNEEDE